MPGVYICTDRWTPLAKVIQCVLDLRGVSDLRIQARRGRSCTSYEASYTVLFLRPLVMAMRIFPHGWELTKLTHELAHESVELSR